MAGDSESDSHRAAGDPSVWKKTSDFVAEKADGCKIYPCIADYFCLYRTGKSKDQRNINYDRNECAFNGNEQSGRNTGIWKKADVYKRQCVKCTGLIRMVWLICQRK